MRIRKRNVILGTILAAVLGLSTACSLQTESSPESAEIQTARAGESSKDEDGGRDSLYQVSLLQGLTLGDYDGSVAVEQLKEKGDIGIGTFDGLNGELIMLDRDETESLQDIASFDSLCSKLDDKVSQLGRNRFYVIRIDGTFEEMHVRSEYAQEKPYKPLAEVLETDQTFYDYENVEGTVVGLYCPAYMEDLNAVGWHLHFISKDRTKGGHVLNLNIDNADVVWDYTDSFSMMLPTGEDFSAFDLSLDQSEDIEKVEKNKE